MNNTELFSDNLYMYTERARQELEAFVNALPCNGIESMSEGYIDAHFLAQHILGEPVLNPEPTAKDIEPDGEMAFYRHKVEHIASMRFRPQSFTVVFGGPRRGTTVEDDYLTIWVAAKSNPGPKEQHAEYLRYLEQNIRSLRGEIQNHNSRLRSLVAPLIQTRQGQCRDLERRRSEL
ncbi:MAG: hypothetical protein ABSE64_08110 [Vulcanimicrobiaceae bacterium]|jgi:hypothetical protein